MKFREHPTFGFTTKADGIARELITEIYVSEAADPTLGFPEPVKKPYSAVWDTGATNTVITRKVVQELNLRPSGKVSVQGVGAGDEINEYIADTYLVNIYLPNRVLIIGIRVSEGSVGGGDVLIGMDIISQGDFAITNYDKQTWWTFRIPSNEHIDFVEEIGKFKALYGPHRGATSPNQRKKLVKERKIARKQQRKQRKKQHQR